MATIVIPFYGYFNSKVKGLINLTKFGKRRSLHFSIHDEVGTNILGLDASKKNLIYINGSSPISSYVNVDLRNVVACSIKKKYDSIGAGELKTKKLKNFLKGIFLNFRFKNSKAIFSIPFYEAKKDNNRSADQSEAIAKKWKKIISELMPKLIMERA